MGELKTRVSIEKYDSTQYIMPIPEDDLSTFKLPWN